MKYEYGRYGGDAGRGILAFLACVLMALVSFAGVARAEDGFLDPSVAFRFSSSEVPGAVKLNYQIADGYYMYRERFAFAVDGKADAQLGTPQIPAGHVKFDTTFNKDVETYRGAVAITLPVERAAGPFDLVVTSQGCSDKGVCYPPAQHKVHIEGAALRAATDSSGVVSAPTGGALSSSAAADQGSAIDRIYSQDYATSVLTGRSLPAILGIFFVLGLALSLLPCSLPMIPILSSIVLGEGTALTRRRGFALSLAYVLGMAVVYTAFGIAAALAGQSLGAMLQNPWVLGVFAVLLTAFALSLLGCYEVQLPASWQSRVSGVSQRLSGGKMAAVFVMGALSALVVGACMTAPLFGVLAFIAQTGNVVVGGASLFMMALGIGVPLLIVGVGAGSVLPRAGAWMESVKRAFGVLLLAAAVWIVAPVLPAALGLLAWALVLLIAAVGLGVFGPVLGGASTPGAAGGSVRLIGRALGGLAALFAVALVAGAAAGSHDPLKPLAVFAGGGSGAGGVGSTGGNAVAAAGPTTGAKAGANAAASGLPFAQVRSLDQLAAATRTAGRPSMLFFHADWCTSCVETERFVFTDPKVRAAMANFALIEADVTENNANDTALLKQFGLFGPPAILFFDAQGKQVAQAKVVGYQPADRFVVSLERAAAMAGAGKEASNEAAAMPAHSSSLGNILADEKNPSSASLLSAGESTPSTPVVGHSADVTTVLNQAILQHGTALQR